MNILSEIEEKLRDTLEVIAVSERAYAETPSPAIALGLLSLRKRRERLEEQYREAAKEAGVDVSACPPVDVNQDRTTPAFAQNSTTTAH